MKAISLHSIVPVRAEAREGSEQNTQMLFAETCTIMEEKPRWNRIKLDLDGQEGWVDTKMIAPMSEKEYEAHISSMKSAALVAFPVAYAMSENNGQTIPLTAGTRLPKYKGGTFELLGVKFRIDASMVRTTPAPLNLQTLLETTRFFLNTPYLWGGKNALGMDCSGFTQVIMSLFGKSLLRNASEQATQGIAIPDLSHAQAGDLVFFNHHSPITNDQSSITHVGIVLDSERVIHCSGRVKVEKLTGKGIFSTEKGEYTHHLVQIRRLP